MKLGLLGDHPDLKPILAALESVGRHTIRWAACVSEEFHRDLRTAELLPRWEAMLSLDSLDAVLVGGSSETVQQAARQIAAEDIPLILLPLASLGSAFLYELSLVRDDRHVPLFPFFPLRRHRLVSELQHRLQDRRHGALLQLTLDRLESVAGRVSLAACDHRLLWDLDLLRQLGGPYNQITAFRAGLEFTSVASTSVAFAGREMPEANWTLRGGNENRWNLTARCSAGELNLTGRNSCEVLSLGGAGDAWEASDRDLSDAIQEELDQIETVIESRRLDDGWTDLVHEMEAVEATYQSVRRRRTIDLHHEVTSERNLFKTQMAAIGCGVLMGTLFLSVVTLIVGKAFDLGPTTMKILRVMVFAPLFVFLFLQFLLPLARPTVEGQPEQPDGSG